MSNLYIAEYAALAATEQSDSIPLPAEASHLVDQLVTFTGTPGTSAAFQSGGQIGIGSRPSVNGAPITEGTKWVLLTSDASCSILFGTLASLTTTPAAITNQFLPANTPRLCRVPENKAWAVSVIAST